jgi:hypothetical protein
LFNCSTVELFDCFTSFHLTEGLFQPIISAYFEVANMTRNMWLGVAFAAAFCAALPALAQDEPTHKPAQRVRPPFTAEFKTTRVQTLANGTTITTETKDVSARDQQMRRMEAHTTLTGGDQPAYTYYHVSDPTTGDEINWNSTSKVAHDLRRPVGDARHGCWATPDGHSSANFGGNGPLQPLAPPNSASAPVVSTLAQGDSAPRASSSVGSISGSVGSGSGVGSGGGGIVMLGTGPGPIQRSGQNQVQREDLGTDTIMGVQVRGSRTTITTPAGVEGNDQPLVRVDETWMAPSLGLTLRSTTDDPRTGKMVRETVSLDLSDPDPALFQIPADYKVDMQEMQPVPCGQ